MQSETEAYLSELENPEHLSIEDAQAGALALLELTGKLDQQISRWSRSLQMADVTEGDEGVRARFEAHRQIMSAMKRDMEGMEAQLRRVTDGLRQITAAGERLRDMTAP